MRGADRVGCSIMLERYRDQINNCLPGTAVCRSRKENCDCLHQSPTDGLAIADLEYRKLIIANEIQHNRRFAETFWQTHR